jgi:hypothetical protein
MPSIYRGEAKTYDKELGHICVETVDSRVAKTVNCETDPELIREKEQALEPLGLLLLSLLGVRVDIVHINNHVSIFISLSLFSKLNLILDLTASKDLLMNLT